MVFSRRLPVVSECSPQRASSNSSGTASAASSGSTAGMAVSRVPSPPPPEVNTPVAENWCYTQVRTCLLCTFPVFVFLIGDACSRDGMGCCNRPDEGSSKLHRNVCLQHSGRLQSYILMLFRHIFLKKSFSLCLPNAMY